MFSCGLITHFRKPAEQFFKNIPHIVVGDLIGMEVNFTEFGHKLPAR
jgi:hypothetical protein